MSQRTHTKYPETLVSLKYVAAGTGRKETDLLRQSIACTDYVLVATLSSLLSTEARQLFRAPLVAKLDKKWGAYPKEYLSFFLHHRISFHGGLVVVGKEKADIRLMKAGQFLC